MSWSTQGMARVSVYSACLSVLFAGQSLGFIIDPDANPWLTTASGSRTANGQPATLTWGFVGDGTTVSDGVSSLGGSDLIAKLNTTFGGNPAESDHRLQPWFGFFDDSLKRWSDLSGLSYVYEPNDTGQIIGSLGGVLNVRPDIRIGGASVDGASGTLAFNFFPNNADMVLDTDDMGFFANPVGTHVQIRNTIMHEAGHGLGFEHVVSDTDTLLMEPSISISIDGPQLDEVRGAHFYYGDVFEKSNGGAGNGTSANAVSLGTIGGGATASIGVDADVLNQRIGADDVDFVSVSNGADVDFFSFTVTEAGTVGLTLEPLGGLFNQTGQGGTPTPFDASVRADLSLTLWDTDGLAVLAVADLQAAGGIESLLDIALPGAGEYFASIATTSDTVQLYRLDISVQSLPEPIIGDLNGDGFVGIDDLNLVLGAWNQGVPPGNALADPSGDGFVGIADLNVVLGNWNAGVPPVPPGDGLVNVPEPGTLWLVGAGGLMWVRRGRGTV